MSHSVGSMPFTFSLDGPSPREGLLRRRRVTNSGRSQRGDGARCSHTGACLKASRLHEQPLPVQDLACSGQVDGAWDSWYVYHGSSFFELLSTDVLHRSSGRRRSRLPSRAHFGQPPRRDERGDPPGRVCLPDRTRVGASENDMACTLSSTYNGA